MKNKATGPGGLEGVDGRTDIPTWVNLPSNLWRLGLPWGSRGYDSALPIHGSLVQSPVGNYIPHATAIDPAWPNK